MFKDTITYTDFNGNTQSKDLYFHMSSPELLSMEFQEDGTELSKQMESILASENKGAMIEIMQDFIKKSYGIKSEDGQRFIKSPEVLDEFLQSEAYNAFFMKLFSEENYMVKFITGIIPNNVQALASSDSKADLIQKFKDREANQA